MTEEQYKELVELLTPISMLATYYVAEIEAEVKREKSLESIKKTRTAASEMKKRYKDGAI